MERKKWTPKVDITDSHLKFREKRKWQLTLRRYVLDGNVSTEYAFYFGLSIEQFRNWIEIQFTPQLNWGNFGSAWQFDHIVPVAYFDFSIEEELLLCWNFINIRVKKIESSDGKRNAINIISAKPYFQALYRNTGYYLCLRMIDKIQRMEVLSEGGEPAIEGFIINNKADLEVISTLSKDEFNSLNMGISLQDVLLEREIIKKFG